MAEDTLLLKIKGDASQLRSELGGASRDIAKFTSSTNQFGSVLNNFRFDRFISGPPLISKVFSELSRASQSAKKDAGDVSTATTSAGSALAGLAGPVGIAVGAITIGAGALTALGVGLFDVTQKSASFAAHLNDLSQRTGVSVGLLSSLKVVFETTGGSIEQGNKAFGRYLQTVSDANHKNEEAAKNLKQVGIDYKQAFTSPDEAIRLLIDRIGKLSNDEDRLNALRKVGIRDGQSLNAVLHEISNSYGDLNGLIARAKELGFFVTAEQAENADRMDDSLKILELQVKSLVYSFGRELIPAFTDLIEETGKLLESNKSLAEQLGRGMARSVAELESSLYGASAAYKTLEGNIDNVALALQPVLGLMLKSESVSKDVTSANYLLGDSFGYVGAYALSTINPVLGLTSALLKYFRTLDSRGRGLGDKGLGFDLDLFSGPAASGLGDKEGKAKKGGADKARQEQIRILEGQAKEAERIYKNETDSLKREFDLRITNLRDYTEKAISEEQKRFEAKRNIILREQALAKTQSEREKYEERLLEAQDEKDKNIQKLRDEADKQELDALTAHNNALLDLFEEFDRLRIDSIKETIALEGVTEEKGQQQIADIERGAYKRRWDELIRQREDLIARVGGIEADANQEELQRIKDQIRKIEDAELAAQAERERRIAAGKARDLEREQASLDALFNAEKKYRDRQAEADRYLYLNIRPQYRAYGIAKIAELDIKALEEENRRNRAQLDKEEAEQVAKLKGQEDFEEKKLQIHLTYEALRDQEDEILRRRRAEREKQAEEEIFRAKHPGIAGFLGASGLGQLGEQAEEFGVMGAALQNLGDIAGNVFSSMAQGIGQMVGNWVLLGDQADISIKKMTASVLAGLATQAATMALFFGAMGVVSLTPWGAALFGPAGPWFQGAILMGAVAVGAAIAGRALAGSSFQNKPSSSQTFGNSAQPTTPAQPTQPQPVDVGRTRGEASVQGVDQSTPAASAQPTQTVRIELGLKDHVVAEHFVRDFQTNGPTRFVITTDGVRV